MRWFWLLLALPLHAQMPLGGITGSSGSSPTTVIYAGKNCTGSAGTCSWTAQPSAGNAVVGVVWSTSASAVTGVCDGTGTGGCTGSSTYQLTGYANGSNFESWLFYTCNYQGTSATGITFTGGTTLYSVAVVASGNTTTGTNCNDGSGPSNNQATTGTSYSTGAITTTNANDMLVGLFSNNSGAGTYSVGTDGQGNTMTQRGQTSQVVMASTFNETATNSFTASATYTASSQWNGQVFAIK